MTTIDPVVVRAAQSCVGDPRSRVALLVRFRDTLVEGRVDGRLLVAWLGEEIGTAAIEACVRVELHAHTLDRKAVADEALCALLEALEEGVILDTRARAHDPALASDIVAHALEQRFVTRWSSLRVPSPARFVAAPRPTHDEAPSPRPLESVLRRRLDETR